jgi:hypothetical protein
LPEFEDPSFTIRNKSGEANRVRLAGWRRAVIAMAMLDHGCRLPGVRGIAPRADARRQI